MTINANKDIGKEAEIQIALKDLKSNMIFPG